MHSQSNCPDSAAVVSSLINEPRWMQSDSRCRNSTRRFSCLHACTVAVTVCQDNRNSQELNDLHLHQRSV